jgi:hypothetical protein
LEQHSKGKDDAAADGLPIQSLQPARPQDSFPLPRTAFRAKARSGAPGVVVRHHLDEVSPPARPRRRTLLYFIQVAID